MEITRLLHQLQNGERDALDLLIPLVYDELKKLARAHLRREVKSLSLQTTALVHETFLKMAAGRHPSYENRSHFYGIASRLMRQVLVDVARANAADKRGAAQEIAVSELPEWSPQPNRSLLAIEEALQQLEHVDSLKGKLIEMRFFGGMTAEESAAALQLPVHVVRRELRLARAWLRREMAGEPTAPLAHNLT
jgi:RNA polymerase sigma factor (TIGR02999 family)